MTIAEVDSLLDQLASLSAFSQLSQPGPSTLSVTTILARLYRDSNLSPHALAVLSQIILRDLRPLLSPLPKLRVRNPTSLLRVKSTAGPEQLSLYDAMRCWNVRMLEMYKDGKGSLDYCADLVEGKGDVRKIPPGPIFGVDVPVGQL
jgi:DNA ligase-4